MDKEPTGKEMYFWGCESWSSRKAFQKVTRGELARRSRSSAESCRAVVFGEERSTLV